MRMWRQGDVLMAVADEIPEGARKLPHCTLAEGELTGHSHRVAEPEAAELFEKDGVLYLSVKAQSATVVHDEHGPITLGRGMYRVWKQREYSPAGSLEVRD